MKQSVFDRINRWLGGNQELETSVPTFFAYGATQADMTADQREFYRKWLANWERGAAIPIDEQFSYLFCYMQELVHSSSPQRIASDLSELLSKYPTVNKQSNNFISFVSAYIADAHVLQHRYDLAIQALAKVQLKVVEIHPILRNKLLSIKLFMSDDVSGLDILTLFGSPALTRFGRSNFFEVAEMLDELIAEERGRHGDSYLAEILKQHECADLQEAYPLYGYHRDTDSYLDWLPYYYFYTTPTAYPFAVPLVREAENRLRERFGVPKIGEGWVAETELYYKLKDAFSGYEVLHHASPEWLGRQHLDIYFPAISVAVEYQGRQHFEPIEFFGGEKAFRVTQERDARKKNLCRRNGVTLIYVRSGYVLDEVIAQINAAMLE